MPIVIKEIRVHTVVEKSAAPSAGLSDEVLERLKERIVEELAERAADAADAASYGSYASRDTRTTHESRRGGRER